jgi:HPt (histidine-containing phosphotransfer) domain-containing protein
MDEMQSCLNVLRNNDVDVDNAVDRLMGNDNLYLEFIKRLPEELHLATIREALAQQDAESFHFHLHNLKGFAVNLGITEIADAAQAGLTEFRASQFRNITKLEGLLEEIEASGEKFASALVEIEEIEHAGDDVKKLE